MYPATQQSSIPASRKLAAQQPNSLVVTPCAGNLVTVYVVFGEALPAWEIGKWRLEGIWWLGDGCEALGTSTTLRAHEGLSVPGCCVEAWWIGFRGRATVP